MSAEQDAAYARLGRAFAEVLRLELAGALPAPVTPAAPPDGVRLLTLDEVADRLGLGLTSVKALLGRAFTPVHQGRAVRVASDDVDAYIARLRAHGQQRIQGEQAAPIDLGKSRRQRAASSAAGRGRTARTKKAASVRS